MREVTETFQADTLLVMAEPDYRMPFKLAVDASDVGARSVLFQEDKNGLDHPVSFFSKTFANTR